MSNDTEQAVVTQGQITGEALAELVAKYALEKKAHDVKIIDVRGIAGFTDFFVIASGGSDRQTKAIFDSIDDGVKAETGLDPIHKEGLDQGDWVLADYFDVIVHIFTPETREFYRVEKLWGEGKIRTVKDSE